MNKEGQTPTHANGTNIDGKVMIVTQVQWKKLLTYI